MTDAVTVTIPPATFAAEAELDAGRVRTLDAEAQGYLTTARRVAAALPVSWRAPGGADATAVLALIESDAAEVRASSMSATAAAAAARDAPDAPAAEGEAYMAHVYERSAVFTTGSIARMLGHLSPWTTGASVAPRFRWRP